MFDHNHMCVIPCGSPADMLPLVERYFGRLWPSMVVLKDDSGEWFFHKDQETFDLTEQLGIIPELIDRYVSVLPFKEQIELHFIGDSSWAKARSEELRKLILSNSCFVGAR